MEAAASVFVLAAIHAQIVLRFKEVLKQCRLVWLPKVHHIIPEFQASNYVYIFCSKSYITVLQF